uniref:Uncharacterized protein n=1 Tax=Rhizophora mucronata TaxID=61149 RepID=A0A2P2JBX4_RHIMU
MTAFQYFLSHPPKK